MSNKITESNKQNNILFLINGQWKTQEEYLALTDEEYEKILKKRKSIVGPKK